LPVPPCDPPTPPAPPGPRGPGTEYDPGYLYIPDRAPEAPVVVSSPSGRWWWAPSVELAWVSPGSAPQAVRLRPPDLFGGTVPGLNVPLGGRTTGPFQAGFGLSAGRWFGDDHLHALEASLFVLPGSTRTFDGFAPGTLLLFPDGPAHSAPLLVRFPSPLSALGTTFPVSTSTRFVGADLNYRVGLLVAPDWRVDLLAGYRFAYLEDEVFLGDEPTDGQTAYKRNRLTVEDTFHGGQLGLAGRYQTQTWYTDGTVKLAYGGVIMKSAATGAFLSPEQMATFRTDTRPAFLPTVNVRLGYRLSDRGRLFAAYTFQYLNRVERLGDAFTCESGMGGKRDFWVQSLGLGFEWGY
jgi:hypothetical protein